MTALHAAPASPFRQPRAVWAVASASGGFAGAITLYETALGPDG